MRRKEQEQERKAKLPIKNMVELLNSEQSEKQSKFKEKILQKLREKIIFKEDV